MRSQTGNLKSCHIPSALLWSAAASFVLSSCAAVPDRTALLRSPPYLAMDQNHAAVTAATHLSGSFGEQNGCVVFRTADDGPVMTPVFPGGQTSLVTDGTEWVGLYVRGAPVGMGKTYSVRGADTAHALGVALAAPVPSACPTSTFVVQSVGDQLADVTTHCAGVTVCRWFIID